MANQPPPLLLRVCGAPLRRSTAGFTLIELMVVAAVIVILAAIALPAYNNYTLKSKFAETVLATAPTKTAISVCAVSGDCIVNGAISLASGGSQSGSGSSGGSGGSGGAGTGTGNAGSYSDGLTNLNNTNLTSTTPTSDNSSMGILYAYAAALDQAGDPSDNLAHAVPTAVGWAQSGANDYIGQANPSFYGPGYYCLQSPATGNSCNQGLITAAQMAAYYTPASNAYFPSQPATNATLMSLPCVGGGLCSPSTKYAASVSYDANGVITATAATTSGLNGETFVLTPIYQAGVVDWSVSGTCKTRAGGALC